MVTPSPYITAAGEKLLRAKLDAAPKAASDAAGAVDKAARFVLAGDYRMAYFAMCEAYGELAAAPKVASDRSREMPLGWDGDYDPSQAREGRPTNG